MRPKGSFQIFDKEAWRHLTAQAITAGGDKRPDIACLMEVENLPVLRKFNRDYLKGYFKHALLIDSRDPRLIDVGVLSNFEIVDIKTHMDEPSPGGSGYLFSRDCLEVTFDVGGMPLVLFVNHLKSQYIAKGSTKQAADDRRKAQATRVMQIVRQRFGTDRDYQNAAFAVVGDFNDTPGSDALVPLLGPETGLENVVNRIQDETMRWTHWYESKNRVSQLDYILLSPGLARGMTGELYIERRGLSTAKKTSHLLKPDGTKGPDVDFSFERFQDVTDEVSASDHCPVFTMLSL